MQMENFKKGITSIAIGTEEIPLYSKLIWLQREDYHWQMAKKKEESEVYAKCLERKEIYKQFNKLKLDFDKYFLCLQKRKDKRHAERLWLIDV